MNELLQKHGCSNVFSIPDGLRELMADISREVLREQPVQICDFIANYLSALLITREHGILAVKILDDLCDCRPSVSEHLIQTGMPASEARELSEIINDEIKSVQLVEGKEKIKEADILKRILKRNPMDEESAAKVCQIARNAYRDYWYRKKTLEQNLKVQPDEPWEIAAQHTLEIYKRTKPSFTDLTRATQKIQAAYRGYHVRRQMLNHLKPKKPQAPKVDLLGPPIDIAESREIDLGPVVDIQDKVGYDDMTTRFVEDDHKVFGIGYDTMKTITQEESEEPEPSDPNAAWQDPNMAWQDRERGQSRIMSSRNMYEQPISASNMQAKSKKSGLALEETAPSYAQFAQAPPLQESEPMPYRKSDLDELPAPLENTEAHLSFGPPQQIEADQFIPEDIPAYTENYVSEVPTPTFDLEISSAQTASVPTSGTTTAPTSDVEDIAVTDASEDEA